MTVSFEILLDSIADLQYFVKCANDCTACDIKAKSGNYVVNGKSILGLLSLDLSTPIAVIITSDDDVALEKLKVHLQLLPSREIK